MHGIFSADSHVDLWTLPPDLFTSNSPKEFHDRVPRVVEGPEGPEWKSGNQTIMYIPDVGNTQRPKPGLGAQIDRIAATGFYDDGANGHPHPSDPELRMRDQELDGVDGEVIYGLLSLDRQIGEPEATWLSYQIYNDWLADFCQTNPNRFIGLGCVLNDDPSRACEEFRRVAKKGLKGIELRVNPDGISLWNPQWDQLWATAEDLDLSIALHLPGIPIPGPSADEVNVKLPKNPIGTYGNMGQVLRRAVGGGPAHGAGSLILSGVLERHPKFTMVLGEVDIGWIPYFLSRMDTVSTERTEFPLGLPLLPSEYWKRQCLATYQTDIVGTHNVGFIGAENIMWASDYPHPNGVWPKSQEVIKEELHHLDQETYKKIVNDNVRRVYKID